MPTAVMPDNGPRPSRGAAFWSGVPGTSPPSYWITACAAWSGVALDGVSLTACWA